MIRKFTAGTGDAEQKAFTAKAKTPDGTVGAGRKATGDANPDAPCISPAWRPGRHPLSDPYARKSPGIEGQAGKMYIEYVTVGEHKVLHQMRAVEEGPTRTEEFDGAVRRLQATGFKPMDRATFGNSAWTDGKTEAHIRFGSLPDVRGTVIGDVHEYSFLD